MNPNRFSFLNLFYFSNRRNLTYIHLVSSKRNFRDAPIASAAALVAAQCVIVAEAMGDKKEDLSSVIGSAMSGTSASDILTLTVATATYLVLL
uniref:VAN3-binding protein-like isoform X2 n=1 Tax=Cicer arietinum TaxID=3827 RepID=A0A3Q7Y8R4_CICAR|nr:VAN3-binding protein-like isoform X2 [Cicer arietinum]